MLKFVDLPRHERLRYLVEQYYKIADAAIAVYDITQDTLGEAKSYVEDLRTMANPDIVVALVARNKADRSSERVVNYKVIYCCQCPH